MIISQNFETSIDVDQQKKMSPFGIFNVHLYDSPSVGDSEWLNCQKKVSISCDDKGVKGQCRSKSCYQNLSNSTPEQEAEPRWYLLSPRFPTLTLFVAKTTFVITFPHFLSTYCFFLHNSFANVGPCFKFVCQYDTKLTLIFVYI